MAQIKSYLEISVENGTVTVTPKLFDTLVEIPDNEQLAYDALIALGAVEIPYGTSTPFDPQIDMKKYNIHDGWCRWFQVDWPIKPKS
jgi:hypothetical protein